MGRERILMQSTPQPTPDQQKALRRLITHSWDLILDLRHWQCLCDISRRTKVSVTDVLRGILEKVFVNDLGLITPLDDQMDKNLKVLRARLQRIRRQPKKLQEMLAQRKEELFLLADMFPEEVDAELEDMVSRLRARYQLPDITKPMEPEVVPKGRIDAKIEELTKALSQSVHRRAGRLRVIRNLEDK